MNEIERILDSIGESKAPADELLPLVYEELRKLARFKLAQESPGQTLQATALVHEAYLKLVGGRERPWKSRGYFFAAAAEAMRRILIDRARRRASQRHGGGAEIVDIDDLEIAAPAADDELLSLNAALDRLGVEHRWHAELVKLRYFAGLTLEEAAESLDISEATAKRYWTFARAWLFRAMRME